jgi:hypothetical protein
MRSSAAIALLALAAACTTRDPETTPFAIRAARAGGADLLQDFGTGAGFQGTGRVVDESTLVVEGAVLAPGLPPEEVTVTFDRAATDAPRFSPARLDGRPLFVLVGADATFVGPRGEPLPIYELRVATVGATSLQNELFLAERVFPAENITQEFPVNALPGDDTPRFTATSDWSQYEPGECGPVYYDLVLVQGDDEQFFLRREEQRQVAISPILLPDPRDPWTVLHVQSWHRQGACAGQARAWTQVAAWR